MPSMNLRYRSKQLVPALILVYDIIDFTQFFNQPDVFNFAPVYLNIIDQVMDDILKGKKPYWSGKPPQVKYNWHKVLAHRKFLGDGELLVFKTDALPRQTGLIKSLINDIWTLTANFEKVNKKIRGYIPVADLPTGLRFSMTRGSVMEMTLGGTRQKEYIGFPINLAGRLQSYCRELRFIASAKIGPQRIRKNPREFKKLVIKKLKGFPPELVYVDTLSYSKLSKKEQASLFKEI